MNTALTHITLLGSGPVADLLAQRITAQKTLHLLAHLATHETPPGQTQCVLYLPTLAEIASGIAASNIIVLLEAGYRVISTLPAASLDHTALLAACRAGGTVYHGSGGFQSELVVRFNRAFASITRNIQNVQLIEELDLAALPAYPWDSADDLQSRPQNTDAFYQGTLHTLADAIFGDPKLDTPITTNTLHRQHEADGKSQRFTAPSSVHQVEVKRELDAAVAYDSVWRQRQPATPPLQYRLNTCSSDATGTVTLQFHQNSTVHPADHLTCNGLLNAIPAVLASAPGILHHDLEINHVKSDDRLTR